MKSVLRHHLALGRGAVRFSAVGAAVTASASGGQDTTPGVPQAPLERRADEAVSESSVDLASFVDSRLTVSGVLAGGFQFLLLDGGDEEGGALTIRPSLDFALTEADHLHVTVALSGGKGVNGVSPLALAPWAADLEDDIEDINGSDVDYLQGAWYRRSFKPGAGQSLALTAGFIDSTEYLDQNEFANDEYTQFMNEVFVNAPTGSFPSYDLGAALEWSGGPWSVNAAAMRVAENDDGNSYLFAGAQLGYYAESGLGAGNYRVTLGYASDEFLGPGGSSTNPLLGVHVSADQRLGEILGVWARLGVQDDSTAVTHRSLLSGGVNLSGRVWGRDQDNAGIGYAYLDGGNTEISSTHALEAYARFAITPALAASVDMQYLSDSGAGSVDGVVLGARVVYAF